MSSKQKSESKGTIAVVGERELVIGYRLLGIEDTFIVKNKDEAFKIMDDLYSSNKYAMIIASQFVHESLPQIFKSKIESSIEPLFLFMPSLKGNIEEESISVLAKRVLGISIKMG